MTRSKNQVNPSTTSGQDLLSIQKFAQVCITTPRTLRFYEQKGLFKPAKIDPNNKYRFYHPRQARDFLRIRLLQNFHIPLKQIKQEIASGRTVQYIPRNDKNSGEGYLQKRLNELREEIEEKEKEYKFLKDIKAFLFSPHPSPSPPRGEGRGEGRYFQTKYFGPFDLFCMKVQHGEYAKITDYLKTLCREARRLKLNCEPSEITFYLNNAYNPKNTPMEIALILKENNSLTLRAPTKQSLSELEIATPRSAGLAMTSKNFYFKRYPKTKILAYEYTGPYDYLILIYQKLYSYFETRKINLKGFVFETYKHGPFNTNSKYDYQMTIGFPI